jgi:hypothetical protein
MQLKHTTQKNQEPTCIITIGAKTNTNKPTFESVLTQAVDEVFSSLGCKENIYSQLETKYALPPLSIALNIEAFASSLNEMYGDASLLVEIKIMYQLHSKTSSIKYYLHTEEDFTFSAYLKNLKAYLF